MLSLLGLRLPVFRRFCTNLHHQRRFNQSAVSLSERYQTLVKSNTIQFDKRQEHVVKILDPLYRQIQLYNPPKLPDKPILETSAGTFDKSTFTPEKKSKPGIFQKMLNFSKAKPVTWTPPESKDIPNSLYVWGGTGTGKTMLMDLFFDSIDSHPKYRAHFNTFMLELHNEIHEIETRSSTKLSLDDIIPQLSLNIARKSTILYLDELQVTDLVDALLLNRLLTSLFHYGCICFVTSNREPENLYLHGLQRASMWMPFMKSFKEKSTVIDLNTINYRDLGYGYGYFLEKQEVEDAWNAQIQILNNTEETKVVDVMAGRELVCPRSVGNDATRFNFRELCAESKGTADYLALSKSFNTVFIENIPTFSYDPWSRNEMKRFIWLIDELYNGKNRIVCWAAKRPEELLVADKNQQHEFEEVFQFERCKKRLIEMQSTQYWEETEHYGPLLIK